ncbi:MAB_1171c family putative transporter [Streptomyces sp. NPDC097619]|uniref:MAB_1171c family putative transporter n=1 Tax=Streptomyces sp. NPDC097619 TaxID=3157228 RepID=UPI003328BD28
MNGEDYYIPAAALWIALAFKIPSLLRNWRDPLLRAVCSLLTLAGAVFAFAAPPTIAAVNRLTGIPNVSAPLVYCLISAFSASCLVLIVNWRGGPPERTREVSRRWIICYSIVIVALIVFFALGEAPEEHLRDLDTHYSGTPFIREMIVLYLVAHAVAAVVMVAMCWRWALQVHGWLRTGLVIIVIGYLFNVSYDVTKFAAIGARWAGHDWDGLSTFVAPPLASLGALISSIGFVVPLVCQRAADHWRAWATYRRLGTLWRELQSAAPPDIPRLRIAWWSPVDLRVTQRESDIHDGFLNIAPYLDADLHNHAYGQAIAHGTDSDMARSVADAAVVAAAVQARVSQRNGDSIDFSQDHYPDPVSRPRDLVRISHALRHSPVVAAVRRNAAGPESGH